MLHAGVLAPFGNRFIKRIVRRGGAELRHITGAEGADRVAGELKLGDRDQIERAQLVGRALRLRIETADRFHCVAEKIKPHRAVHAGREQIDDTAAHCIIAGLAHGGSAVKPMSSSHWMMFAIGATLPGATDNDCLAIAARSGTRCRTALTVVRSTAGCSRPVTRARRASVITRCATTARCGETRS